MINLKLLTPEEIYFEIGGYGGYDIFHVFFQEEDRASIMTTIWCEPPVEKHYSKEETLHLLHQFKLIQVDFWNSEYINPSICDGTQWRLFVKYSDQRGTIWEGSNAYPNNWDELLSFFGIDYDDELDGVAISNP